MPNIVHLPICPFFKYEKRKSICCEDTYRGFMTAEAKESWLYMYCDTWDWMRCPYAADRSEAYERLAKGDGNALDKQEKEAMKKEMKSLSTKLGRAEKKIERMQKKIDELRAVNQSFTRVNETLQKRWKEAEEKLRGQDDPIWAELEKLSGIYEQRICYLIDTFVPDKKFYDKDAAAWAGR